MTVSPSTIESIGRELQEQDLAPDRAAELAAEVDGINRRVHAVARASFGFFDEPAHFTRLLEELRED